VDRRDRNRELVALSAATVFVYRQVTGEPLDPADVDDMNHVMQEVAHAISYVADIYAATSEDERQKPLPHDALRGGSFERGATILRSAHGVAYRKLGIRRDDMRLAAEVLRRAGVKFPTGPK
jgi:hypothetical protein